MKNSVDFDREVKRLTDYYLEFVSRGEVNSWKGFAKLLGVDPSTLSGAKNGNPKYLTTPFIEKVTFICEKMLQQKQNGATAINSPLAIVVNGDGNNIRQPEEQSQPEELLQPQSATALVPTIPYRAYTAIGLDLRTFKDNPGEQLHYSPVIASLGQTDYHCFVNSDAMKPYLHPNDVLALKMVPEDSPVVNGEIYIINTKSLGLLTRFVYDDNDHYLLKAAPEQDRYTDIRIPKSDVFVLLRIIGLMRTNI